jgi:hypothetical protein
VLTRPAGTDTPKLRNRVRGKSAPGVTTARPLPHHARSGAEHPNRLCGTSAQPRRPRAQRTRPARGPPAPRDPLRPAFIRVGRIVAGRPDRGHHVAVVNRTGREPADLPPVGGACRRPVRSLERFAEPLHCRGAWQGVAAGPAEGRASGWRPCGLPRDGTERQYQLATANDRRIHSAA